MFVFRLVKFESTKSLASTSSRSLGGALSENGDREMALQNVLTFIAEQQKYVHSREHKESRPCSVNDITKEFNIEGPPQHLEDLKIFDCGEKSKNILGENENYVTLKQLATEFTLNEQNCNKGNERSNVPNISYAEEVCLVTPLDVESENCSNISEHPVDICTSVNVELTSAECNPVSEVQTNNQSDNNKQCVQFSDNDLTKSGDTLSSDNLSMSIMSESITSSTSTPDTIVSKIPRLKPTASKIPVSPSKNLKNNQNNNSTHEPSKLPKSNNAKTSKISRPIKAQKQKVVQVVQNIQPQHMITSERLPQYSSGVISNIIDGPPHRAVSFHERATSKDVIDELNRMIQKGDDVIVTTQERDDDHQPTSLDEACRPTGWIHVEKDIDLTDPKVRLTLFPNLAGKKVTPNGDSNPRSQ